MPPSRQQPTAGPTQATQEEGGGEGPRRQPAQPPPTTPRSNTRDRSHRHGGPPSSPPSPPPNLPTGNDDNNSNRGARGIDGAGLGWPFSTVHPVTVLALVVETVARRPAGLVLCAGAPAYPASVAYVLRGASFSCAPAARQWQELPVPFSCMSHRTLNPVAWERGGMLCRRSIVAML